MPKFSLQNLFTVKELKIIGIIAGTGLFLAIFIPLIVILATRPPADKEEVFDNIFSDQAVEKAMTEEVEEASVSVADLYYPKPAFAEFSDGWVSFREDSARWNQQQVEYLTGNDENVMREYLTESSRNIIDEELRDVP